MTEMAQLASLHSWRWSALKSSALKSFEGAHLQCAVATPVSTKARRTLVRRAYFPIQNELKIKFRMSSAVVAPVMSSSGRSTA